MNSTFARESVPNPSFSHSRLLASCCHVAVACMRVLLAGLHKDSSVLSAFSAAAAAAAFDVICVFAGVCLRVYNISFIYVKVSNVVWVPRQCN